MTSWDSAFAPNEPAATRPAAERIHVGRRTAAFDPALTAVVPPGFRTGGVVNPNPAVLAAAPSIYERPPVRRPPNPGPTLLDHLVTGAILAIITFLALVITFVAGMAFHAWSTGTPFP